MLITIGGSSGAGKSFLTDALQARLQSCSVLALDAYYHAQSGLPLEERALQNYDHPDAFDWTLLEQHVSSLIQGESAETPVYLFELHTRAEQTQRIDPGRVIIVEGILALHHPRLRELSSVRVYVETPELECLRRRLERDIEERGRTRESVLEQYASTVQPMALQYVLPSRRYADVIVSGERSVDQGVEEILRHLR